MDILLVEWRRAVFGIFPRAAIYARNENKRNS